MVTVSRAFPDHELDLDRTDRRTTGRRPEKIEIIVGEPNGAELIANLQLQQVAVEGNRLEGLKPQ
jgi:hypothetical protein